jgi:TM2 domain-containing membrane protein YozV
MTYPPQASSNQPPLPPHGQPVPAQPTWPQPAPAQAWGAPGLPGPQFPPPMHPQAYAAVPHPVLPMPYKDSTAAWLLWFFLGSFGAHHFYLGRTKWGVGYAVGFVLSWLLTLVIIGLLGLIALFVLWVIDATQMSQRLQEYNAQAYAVNRSRGLA